MQMWTRGFPLEPPAEPVVRIFYDLPLAIVEAGVTLREFTVRCFPKFASNKLFIDPARQRGEFAAAFRRVEYIEVSAPMLRYTCQDRTSSGGFGPSDRYFAAMVSAPTLQILDPYFAYDKWDMDRHYLAGPILVAVTSNRVAYLSLKGISVDGAELRSFCKSVGGPRMIARLAWVKLAGGIWWPALYMLKKARRAREATGFSYLETWLLDGEELTEAYQERTEEPPGSTPRVRLNVYSPSCG